jgi:hypothetical protein
MKYLIAQGIKRRTVFKVNGQLSGLDRSKNMKVRGGTVKKEYEDDRPLTKPNFKASIKPLNLQFKNLKIRK